MIESSVKVIEYIINDSLIGPVPNGKLIKIFHGKEALSKAIKLRDKLNEKQASRIENSIKGYYIKGDLISITE